MTDIQTLIHLNIEIEGLLHVLATRDSSNARQLLGRKFEEYSNLIQEVINNTPAATEKVDTVPLAQVAETLTQDVVKDEEAVENEEADETDLAVAAIERGREEQLDKVESNDKQVESNDEEEESNDEEGERNDEEVVEAEIVPENIQEKLSASDDNKVRVEQAISRLGARDLRRAFTLNDKFRFRRYLFDNNDTLFAQTLDHLSAMPHYAEAYNYLIEKLGWDANNTDVKDFLAIVENHFA